MNETYHCTLLVVVILLIIQLALHQAPSDDLSKVVYSSLQLESSYSTTSLVTRLLRVESSSS